MESTTQKTRHVFKNTGDRFSGLETAQRWLEENGYSYGSLQRGAPVGVLKGEWAIAKWRNLDKQERDELDGTLTAGGSGSFADDDIVLLLKS